MHAGGLDRSSRLQTVRAGLGAHEGMHAASARMQA
jgi:hypothetical protein